MSRSSLLLNGVTGPDVAVEIAAHRVSAARVELRGAQIAITAHAIEPLATGVLAPTLAAPNVRERAALLGALRNVIEQVGRPRRVGLILPDPVAKVSIVKFQHVPTREQELAELIRWQVKKAAPFAIEEAQVSYVPGATLEDGREFLVVLARRDILREYESLFDELGVHAGLVDLSTFNVVNAVLTDTRATGGDWLLVNVAPDWASVVIVRDSNPIFFRSHTSEGDGALVDLVHQTAMYYEDRLSGAGFARALISGAAASVGGEDIAAVDQLQRALQDRLGTPVDAVNPLRTASLSDRIATGAALLDVLTPLVGMLAREQGTAA